MENKKIDTENFICENCGGTIKFDIKRQKFVCQACKAEKEMEVEQKEVQEYSFEEYKNREKENTIIEGIATAVCSSCGGEVLFEMATTATLCPMCGSSQVSEARQTGGIPPEGVIPFKIDKQDAQEKFRKWVKSRWFAPNNLKKSYGEGKLVGLYIPFWTYDAQVYASYTGQGGKDYQVEGEDGKTTTETEWTPVVGAVSQFFDDIQICASKKSEAEIIQGISPYNTSQNTVPFSLEYLSGFNAEHYSIKADEGFTKAKQIMREAMQNKAEGSILSKGYNRTRSVSIHMTCSDVKYKHVLLPVWSAVFAYRGKQYRYLINGETGAVSGERPYSAIKIITAIIIALLVTFLVFAAVGSDEEYAMSQEGQTMKIVQTIETDEI